MTRKCEMVWPIMEQAILWSAMLGAQKTRVNGSGRQTVGIVQKARSQAIRGSEGTRHFDWSRSAATPELHQDRRHPTASARAVLPVSIASVALFVWVIRSFLFPPRLMPGLPLTQNWIGKSFVHAIFGPYLQRCGNKL